MGLFTRKADSKAELETMKSELRSMRERLDAADAAKAGLAEQLGSVEAENRKLTSRVVEVDTKVGSIESVAVEANAANAQAIAKVEQVEGDVAKIDVLTSRIDELSTALQSRSDDGLPAPSGPALHNLVAQLAELSESIGHQQRQIADVALVATDAAERTAAAETAVQGLAATDPTPTRDDELRQQVGQLAEKVAAMDSRINQISLELTNQLTELSGDLDRAATRSPEPDSDAIVAEIERLMSERIDSTIVDITDGQERLAVEQARYAIAFRQDLADLADSVRKPTNR